MRSAEVVHFEAGSGGMKGNIVRAIFPFISGYRRNLRVSHTHWGIERYHRGERKAVPSPFRRPWISGTGDGVPVGEFIGRCVTRGPGGSSIRAGLLARRLRLRRC